MSVFHGAAPWHINFTLFSIIPLWDSATAHSPSDKEFNPSSQKDARFFRALHYGILISLYPVSSLFESQQQLTLPPVMNSTLPLRNMSVSQGVPLDMFSYYPALALFGLVLAHLTINSP